MIENHLDNLYPPVAFLTENMYLVFTELLKDLETNEKTTQLAELENQDLILIKRYNPGEYVRAPKEVGSKSKEIALLFQFLCLTFIGQLIRFFLRRVQLTH